MPLLSIIGPAYKNFIILDKTFPFTCGKLMFHCYNLLLIARKYFILNLTPLLTIQTSGSRAILAKSRKMTKNLLPTAVESFLASIFEVKQTNSSA